MSFNVKVISSLNDKNAHVFSMFCDLCVRQIVRFRLKSFSCNIYFRTDQFEASNALKSMQGQEKLPRGKQIQVLGWRPELQRKGKFAMFFA